MEASAALRREKERTRRERCWAAVQVQVVKLMMKNESVLSETVCSLERDETPPTT